MKAYEELLERANDGTITFIQLVGVPRSMSTALARTLNETGQPSVFINEPFNRENSDTETAAKSILDAYYNDIEPSVPNAVVITKNMASYTTPEAFKQMELAATATIWNIRHPYVQMGSLLTRIVNDLYSGPGEDSVPQSGIGPYLTEACSFLLDSSKSQDFSKTGWAAIGRLADSPAQSKRITVDGYDFTKNSAACISEICQKTGLVYCDTMLTGWKKGFVNVINIDDPTETSRSAWTRQAAQSAGVLAVVREELEMSLLPGSLQEHITEVAIPVYERLKTAA